MIEKIRKTREYLDYLEEHYNNVQKAFKLVAEKCKDMRFIYDDFYYWSLRTAVENHDDSKMSPEEFIAYRKHFFPVNAEEKKESREDAEKAIDHHYKNNMHHWQSWVPYVDRHHIEIDVAHNFIDWIAMGFQHGDTALEYYEKNKHKINLPAWTEKFFYDICKRVYGE